MRTVPPNKGLLTGTWMGCAHLSAADEIGLVQLWGDYLALLCQGPEG